MLKSSGFFLALLFIVNSSCPRHAGNVCNGHGFCSTWKECICDPTYSGTDCSIRPPTTIVQGQFYQWNIALVILGWLILFAILTGTVIYVALLIAGIIRQHKQEERVQEGVQLEFMLNPEPVVISSLNDFQYQSADAPMEEAPVEHPQPTQGRNYDFNGQFDYQDMVFGSVAQEPSRERPQDSEIIMIRSNVRLAPIVNNFNDTTKDLTQLHQFQTQQNASERLEFNLLSNRHQLGMTSSVVMEQTNRHLGDEEFQSNDASRCDEEQIIPLDQEDLYSIYRRDS